MKISKQILAVLVSISIGASAYAIEKESGGKLTVIGASQLYAEAIYNYFTDQGLLGAEVISLEKLGFTTGGNTAYLVKYTVDNGCWIQKFHVSVSCFIDTDHPEKGLYKHATPVAQTLSCY